MIDWNAGGGCKILEELIVARYYIIFYRYCCASVTKTKTPKRDPTELTSKPAKNPVSVGLTNPQGFILAGIGFGN